MSKLKKRDEVNSLIKLTTKIERKKEDNYNGRFESSWKRN